MTLTSCSSSALTLCPVLVSGYSSCSRLAIVLISAWARAMDTPGSRRAVTSIPEWSSRSANASEKRPMGR
jgi:hypothetical protein